MSTFVTFVRLTKVLRIYFNNHYGGKAVVNALQFKEMIGMSLSEKETKALEQAQSYLTRQTNPWCTAGSS